MRSLNLKDPRAYALASKLSQLTGESLSTAVILALEQRLATECRSRIDGITIEKMLVLSERFAAGVKPGSTSAGHADLFGKDGLPT